MGLVNASPARRAAVALGWTDRQPVNSNGMKGVAK